MDDTTHSHKPLSHRPRTGTEKRKRSRVVGIRMTDEEYAQTEAAAERKGLTVPSYARHTLLAEPQTRSRRRPRADVATLARFCGELNRIGSNINQIARAANSGEQRSEVRLAGALADIEGTLTLARLAMGLEP